MPKPHAHSLTLHVADEAALERLAGCLAAALPRPSFITLHGDLGAGKTTLVKAVAAALGIDRAEVVSPTFGLIHEHTTPHGPLTHADLYRLAGPVELPEIGWDDAVARATWVFVEWPDRLGDALPHDRLDVSIVIDGPTARTLTFTGHGSTAIRAVESLAASALAEPAIAESPTVHRPT